MFVYLYIIAIIMNINFTGDITFLRYTGDLWYKWWEMEHFTILVTYEI